MRKPAQCVGTGGLPLNVAWTADAHGYATVPAPRKDLFIAQRFGVSPSTATVLAELAWPARDDWMARA